MNELADCNNEQLIAIAERVITSNDSLSQYRDTLISFITEKQVDGQMMMNYGRKQFVQEVADFADNKKIKGNATKFFKAMESFDVRELTGVPIETVSAVESDSETVCETDFILLFFFI